MVGNVIPCGPDPLAEGVGPFVVPRRSKGVALPRQRGDGVGDSFRFSFADDGSFAFGARFGEQPHREDRVPLRRE